MMMKIELPSIRRFMNFSVVGAVNFFLSYFIYAGSVSFGIHHQIANQISFWVTVANGYILNKYWVFQRGKSGSGKKEAGKYVFVYGMNYLLGIYLLYLYVDVLAINKYLAPLVSMPITIPLNYYLNKKWIFHRK